MKLRSLDALVALVGCSALVYACSSDTQAPNPTPDAGTGGGGAETGGTGGHATGGKSGSGGGPTTGGAKGSGGTVVDSGTDGADASDASGTGGGSGGADAATGGTAGTGGKGGTGGIAPDGACTHCGTPYPKVPYPAENQPDDNKAMLGKILFWEEQIGELGKNACGTCHRSEAGGSDPRAATDPAARQPGPDTALETQPDLTSDDIRGGQGVPHCAGLLDGGVPNVTDPTVQVTQRKPPTYFDAMFALGVFWDGRAGYCSATQTVNGCFVDPDTGTVLIQGQVDPNARFKAGGALEAQSVGPPVNPVEMACSDETWPKIHQRLATVIPLANAHAIPADMKQFIADHGNNYPDMFEFVYQATNKLNTTDSNKVINTRRIAYAIATHERRLTSDQTPWDRWNAGDDTAMTANQIAGFNAFMNKGRCGICHTPPLFTDLSFHFLGFHDPTVNADATGLRKITSSPGDMGKFKTPTLRNVGLREPGGLLHSGDGPGHDLTTVMTLYKQGGLRSNTTIAPLIDQQIVSLSLTQQDIDSIIDFLRNGLTDPRVKDALPPFDRPKLSTE